MNLFNKQIVFRRINGACTYLFISSLTVSEPPAPSCSQGEVRLSDSTRQYYSDMYTNRTMGFLEVCYQGSWVSVCLSNASNTNTNQLAELACQNIYYGFGGMSV